ncbi:MAG: hypothetical protein JNM76_07890 [Betaproteobacteria bacterium]|nr:hypothetical protein [Betaproteobacteria bacterium]
MRIFAILFLCCAVRADAADQLERLFFLPAERDRLDELRNRMNRGYGADYVAPTVDGIIRRSDGKGTIWINGKAYDATDRQVSRAASLPPDSRVKVVSVQRGRSSDLARSSPQADSLRSKRK